MACSQPLAPGIWGHVLPQNSPESFLSGPQTGGLEADPLSIPSGLIGFVDTRKSPLREGGAGSPSGQPTQPPHFLFP